VSAPLMPWCKGCQSHHVASMLWRYATVAAGVRLDSSRRYLLGSPGDAPTASEAVRRFLRFYGPATPAGFADWAGVAKPHGRRLWDEVADELAEVDGGWLLAGDVDALESPPPAHGVRLLPPGDPYLLPPNRPLLAPDAELRKRLFRPVASPGAVLSDGRLVGLWRARKNEVTVEPLEPIPPEPLAEETERLLALRGRRPPPTT
jgi:DNA glycosylase AlkZ-like